MQTLLTDAITNLGNCADTDFAFFGHSFGAYVAFWAYHTDRKCELHPIPGDHFFLLQSRDLVITQIRECLELEK
jgi:surfactin synthase thioesterase subunit